MTKEEIIYKEAYKRGYIHGHISAYKELSEVIETYTRALLTAIDAQIEEFEKLEQ